MIIATRRVDALLVNKRHDDAVECSAEVESLKYCENDQSEAAEKQSEGVVQELDGNDLVKLA